MNMNRILADHDDALVHGTYVYFKTTDSNTTPMSLREYFAYSDPECTKKLSRDELYDVCLKGAVFVPYGGVMDSAFTLPEGTMTAYYKPVAFACVHKSPGPLIPEYASVTLAVTGGGIVDFEPVYAYVYSSEREAVATTAEE